MPAWCGGRATEPWPYGEGGELPISAGDGAEGGGAEGGGDSVSAKKGSAEAPASERSTMASSIYSAFFG